eukprot:10148508-Alexandrium_andersonii.AAC.1
MPAPVVAAAPVPPQCRSWAIICAEVEARSADSDEHAESLRGVTLREELLGRELACANAGRQVDELRL